MIRNRGLTLGKFAPLHKGHQLLLDTAVDEMDEVLAIVYDCPEITSVPLTVRANRIRRLYPTVQVVEAWDGPTEVGDSPEIRNRHEEYVLNQLRLGKITHFYSSEFYGEHWSQALGAINRNGRSGPQDNSCFCNALASKTNTLPYMGRRLGSQ